MTAAAVEADPGLEDMWADPREVLREARSYGRLREVEPGQQAAIVREAVNYDPSLHPRWQMAGEGGVHDVATPAEYACGSEWVPSSTPVLAEDGRRYYARRVESGRPHLPWVSRDWWLQVLLPAALEAFPEIWKGRISQSTLRTIMEYATSLVLEPETGRACIVRVDKLALSCDVSPQTVRTAWRVVQELGIAKLMRPGRMLTEKERYEAHDHGSYQRGLANEWCFVTPTSMPRELLSVPHEPVRPPLRLVGARKAPQTVWTARKPAQVGNGSQIGSESLQGGSAGPRTPRRPARRAGLAAVAVDESVSTLTPPRRWSLSDSISHFRSSLRPNHAPQGQSEPPPAARATRRGVGSRVKSGHARPQRGSQRAQAAADRPASAAARTRRVYDPVALETARELVELLPWLAGVRPGRIETMLRRFVNASLPWTARDVVTAIDQLNKRLGRASMTRDVVKAPVALLASYLRGLELEADHPRLDLAEEISAGAARGEAFSQRRRDNLALLERVREARAAGRDLAEVLSPATTAAAAAKASAIRDELAARRAARAARTAATGGRGNARNGD